MRTDLIPGTGTIVRQQRWRILRAEVDPPVTRLDVTGSGGRRTFLTPFDRTTALTISRRPVRVRAAQAAARLAGLRCQTFGVTSLVAARDAAIALYPHQLEPALAAQNGHRRLLLADEVGLGKTVQAGVILAEARREKPMLRALLVVPASLVDQWRHELDTRFQIRADRADAANSEMVGFAEHPWRVPGIWIASADYLKQPHLFLRQPLEPWDVVVVDEAHLSTGLSDRYRAVHELCRRARQVVLLTATPHSGNPAAFRRLMRLGSWTATDPLLVFRRTRQSVALGSPRRTRWHRVRPNQTTKDFLDELDAFDALAARYTTAAVAGHGALLVSVLRRRATSTASALARSVSRRLEWLTTQDHRTSTPDWLQPNLRFDDDDDLIDADERRALTLDLGMPARREARALDRLYRSAVRAMPDDVKLERLRQLLRRVDEPVVVFTEFRHSLEAAAAAIASTRSVVVLHGGLSSVERRAALAAFLCGRASVLIATDVAGVGLNLHSRSRWVVCLDIPWNPVRVEQRVGRVDRIGQTRNVHATLLVLDHEAESRVQHTLSVRAETARVVVDTDVFVAMPHKRASRDNEWREARRSIATTDRLTPTTAWRLSGKAQARVLAAKRSFAEQWRAPRDRGRRAVILVRTLPQGSTRRESRLVFRVPIVDEAGVVLEEHLVAIRVPEALRPDHLKADATTGVQRLIDRRLASRLERVSRVLADRHRRRATVDASLCGYFGEIERARRKQPSLFGQALGTRASDEAAQGVHPRSAASDDPTSVQRISIGPVTLLWVWVR